MSERGPRFDPVALVTLREVRRLIRTSPLRGAAVFFGSLYVVGALLVGGMLVLGNFGGGYTYEIFLGSPLGYQWWHFPALYVGAPWGELQLPLFPTIAMVVVGIGVGLGMAVAAGLVLRLLRPTPEERARGKAVGAVTGLTPAMISLVTLGACCSPSAAATAGIGLVASASATSVALVLYNDWYLGVFQIAVVWASLFAQELLLTVYRGLVGNGSARGPPREPRAGPWLLVGGVRTVLFLGGLLAVLSVGAAWTAVDPLRAGAGVWASWVLQSALLGATALSLALFPLGTVGVLERLPRSRPGRVLPGTLAVAAASVLVWLPAPLPAWGFTSVPDQLLGVVGGPAAWGAAPVPAAALGWLLFRWVVVIAVPSAFAILASVRPTVLRSFFETGVPAPGVSADPAATDLEAPSREPVGPGLADVADGT